MTPGMWIGLIGGVLCGWVVSAVFSNGPKTPLEAFTGDHDASGSGCLTFLALTFVFGLIGLGVGAWILG
jgi:cell division protein FtsX